MEGPKIMQQSFGFLGFDERRTSPIIKNFVEVGEFIRGKPTKIDEAIGRSSPLSIPMKQEKDKKEQLPREQEQGNAGDIAGKSQVFEPLVIKTEPREEDDTQDVPMDLSMTENRKEKDLPQNNMFEISNLTNEMSSFALRRPRLSSVSLSSHFNPVYRDHQSEFGNDREIQAESIESKFEELGFSRVSHTQGQSSSNPYNRFNRGGSTSSRTGQRSIHLCNDSYVAIIGEIILKSPKKMVLLRDIYEEIEKNGVVARTLPRSWKSIIRHRLTVNECFIKCSEQISSYRHFWAIHPNYVEQFQRRIFTSARNYRSSSLSLIHTSSEECMDKFSGKIIKSSSIGGTDIAMKQKVQLKIPKLN